jgi:hypothetical protein
MGVRRKRWYWSGDQGPASTSGHMTEDLTDKNNKNDVIRNRRIDLNCYHDTRSRTMGGRHGVSMVSMNSPDS